MTKRLDQRGLAGILEIIVIAVVIGVLGFVGWKVYGSKDAAKDSNSTAQSEKTGEKTGEKSGEESACPAQPMLASPTDLSLATAVLYPGQVRGNDYKPHGGLRFDNNQSHEISVKVPMDAQLTSGSRYIEQGETQYLLEFTTPCGIKYRLDHLLTLSDKFQKAADASLPAAKPDDSRTTDFTPAVDVVAGEAIATAVGFAKTGNVSFDFGVYDTRKENGTAGATDLARHGVCWLRDWLSATDAAILAALPAGDSVSGKTSDYCK